MLKNIFIGILLVLIGALSFAIFQNKFGNKLPTIQTPTIAPTAAVETQAPTNQPNVSPTNTSPTIAQTSDLDLIKQAFAQKYNKPVSQAEVTISKKDSTHTQGGIKFSGEIAGGWFLAYKKTADEWIIVQDGNGTISCETIEPYNFPTDMAPECVDKNGNLIQR